jgi:O-antigen ligase
VISLLVIVVSTYFAGPIYERASKAVSQFESYMNISSMEKGEIGHSSAGFRLEQWRTISQLFLERPVWGFGAGNAGREINRYVEEGKAHPDIYSAQAETNIVGVHSAYFGKLGTEGIMGFTALLAMLLYPLYIFVRNRRYSHSVFALGLVFSVGFAVFSTTENPFVHDNFTSLFLVFLSILFSSSIRSQYQARA